MSEENRDDNVPSAQRSDGGGPRATIIAAVIGGVALLIATLINVCGGRPINTNGLTPSPTPVISPPARRKIVVLMDKNNSSYRRGERHPGGRSNQQDIEEALRGLDLDFRHINTDVGWPRRDESYNELRQTRPDLIIIHASAFSVERDPQDTSDNFHIFLSKAMPDLPGTKLLIYSTAFQAVPKSRIKTFVSEVNTLRERTITFDVDAGSDGQYFLDSQVSHNLREEVKNLLHIP